MRGFIASTIFLAIWATSTTLAAPSATTTCGTLISGNLSPNGVSGNFKLVNEQLVFDNANLAIGFDIQLKSCGPISKASGTLVAPNGQCLAVVNSIPTGVDCADTTYTGETTWTYTSGFLFWSGPVTSTCTSGLYGYKAADSSGTPANVPVQVACTGNVFPFSVLI